jgi:hypothetical protein
MHFVAKEENATETFLEEESNMDGVDYKSHYKEF